MAEKEKQDSFRVDMGDDSDKPFIPTRPNAANHTAPAAPSNPLVPILAYCAASILMTVTNKYVLGGVDFNLNFFLLCIQVSSYTPSPPYLRTAISKYQDVNKYPLYRT